MIEIETGMEEESTSEDQKEPLELGRKLGRLVIQRMIVPLICAGLMDYHEVISTIKKGVVAAMAGIRKPNKLLAAHLSRSRRWFQGNLKDVREEERRGLVAKSAEVDPEEEDDLGYGYKLMLEILLGLSTVYPESVGLSELRQLVDMPIWQKSDAELAELLEFYGELGVLHITGADQFGPRVCASQRVPKNMPKPEQLHKIGEWFHWVVPLALAHCEGQGDFGGIYAELSPKALARARKKLKVATADIIAEAVAETYKSDESKDNDLKVRIIVAIGATGGLNGKQ